MGRAYGIDLRKRIMKNYDDGMPKKDIVKIFGIGMNTLNRWIKRREETGSLEPIEQTKYRSRKFSDSDLIEFVKNNPYSTLEMIADHFSVRYQSVRSRLKLLNITRRKKPSCRKKQTNKNVKGSQESQEKG